MQRRPGHPFAHLSCHAQAGLGALFCIFALLQKLRAPSQIVFRVIQGMNAAPSLAVWCSYFGVCGCTAAAVSGSQQEQHYRHPAKFANQSAAGQVVAFFTTSDHDFSSVLPGPGLLSLQNMQLLQA